MNSRVSMFVYNTITHDSMSVVLILVYAIHK